MRDNIEGAMCSEVWLVSQMARACGFTATPAGPSALGPAPAGQNRLVVCVHYSTKIFKDDKWAVHYYAPIQGHELVTRRDLIPFEPDHPLPANDISSYNCAVKTSGAIRPDVLSSVTETDLIDLPERDALDAAKNLGRPQACLPSANFRFVVYFWLEFSRGRAPWVSGTDLSPG